jgi:hypothetical protein
MHKIRGKKVTQKSSGLILIQSGRDFVPRLKRKRISIKEQKVKN